MTPAGSFQPEIKFRWCRTVGCRAQVVWLVLTSVTGTRVCLTWKPHLGWYEAAPTPIPCGLHTGFILIKDKVRDAISGSLQVRERDYKVDPFHIVPHKFAVELFLQSDQTSPFWSDVPELRLRYLSSDHLERLVGSTHKDSHPYHQFGTLGGRKWVSSTSLIYTGDQGKEERTPSSIQKNLVRPDGKNRAHPRGLTRGRSHSQLRASFTSLDNLKDQKETSISSPNLSRAFQVAVDLSHASSKFLAGLSSTSSGVCLGFEDGSEPPSPDNKETANNNSPYAAGGETSQDSEDAGEGARRKKSLFSSRDRSLRIEDLTGEEAWRCRRETGAKGFDGSNASSTSYEDLLANISSTRRATFKTELNLLRFDTLAQERLVKEILAPSDSDFEDEEGACEVSDSDIAGHYGCVITFESRSSSMDDVGSPRALEEVLVSLTSNDSHPEVTFEPSQLQLHSSDVEHDSELNLGTPSSSERRQTVPKPRTVTPRSCSGPSSLDNKVPVSLPPRLNVSLVSEALVSVEHHNEGFDSPSDSFQVHVEDLLEDDQAMSDEDVSENEARHRVTLLGDDIGTSAAVASDPRVTPDIAEDDNFQYESLKHEDEHIPIDIRNIDSEDSTEDVATKSRVRYEVAEDEACSRPESDIDESENSNLYKLDRAQPITSSLDREISTDSLSIIPLEDSLKATVREADLTYTKSEEEKDNESDTREPNNVPNEECDVPKSCDQPRNPLKESEYISVLSKSTETQSGSENVEAASGVVSGTCRTLPGDDRGRTLPGDDRGRTLPGDDRGRTLPGDDRGRTLPGDDRGRTLPGDDRGRTLPGDDRGRTLPGDDRGRTLPGDDRGRTLPGDDRGRTLPGDDRGRTLPGDDRGRTLPGDDRGRTLPGDDRGRTLPGDDRGRTLPGDDRGRTLPGDDRGRTLPGDDRGRTLPGDDRGRTLSGDDRGRTLPGDDRGRTLPGDDRGRTLPGDDRGRTLPGDDRGRTLPGDDRGRTLPGDDRGRTLPGDDRGRTLPGDDRGRTLPGDDRGRTLPGDDRGRTLSGDDRGRTLPGDDRGRTLPGDDRGRTLPGDDRGRTLPGDDRGRTLPGDDRGRTLPGDDRSRTLPGDDRGRTLPGDDRGRTLPGDDRGRTLPGDDRGRTLPGDDRGRTLPGDDRGRTLPGDDRGRTLPGDDRGRTLPGDDRGRTLPGDDRGRTLPGDDRGRTLPGDDRGRTLPGDDRGRTLPGDDRGRTLPGDDRGRTLPGDDRGRTLPGDDRGRTLPGDDRGRTLPGDDRGRTLPGDDRGRTLPCDDRGRACIGDARSRALTDDNRGRTFGNNDRGRTQHGSERSKTLKNRTFDGRTFESDDRGITFDSRTHKSGDTNRTLDSRICESGDRGKTLDSKTDKSGDIGRNFDGRTYKGGDRNRTYKIGDRNRTYKGGDRGRFLDVGVYKSGDKSRDLIADERGVSFVDVDKTLPGSDVSRFETNGSFLSGQYRGDKKLRANVGRGREGEHPPASPPSNQHLERDTESQQPRLRFVRLQNVGTQTPQSKRTSKMASSWTYKFSEGEGGTSASSTKYSRSSLRNGQAEPPFTPLPDRLSGPWSQRLARGAAVPPPSPVNADLAALQRNLYNIVQGHENTLYLRQLQSGLRHKAYHDPHLIHHIHPVSVQDPLTRCQQSPIKYHHHQSPVPHTPVHHHPFVHHHPPAANYHKPPITNYHQSPVHQSTTPIQYKYPVLNSTFVQSSSSLAYFTTQPHLASRDAPPPGDRSRGVTYGGSASDLTRLHHTDTFFHHRTGGGSSIRSTSSLPDLQHPAPSHLGVPGHSTPYSHTSPGPTHAYSAFDVMVGSGGGGGAQRLYWDDSDSGGSTDSLIDEAEHLTTSPLHPNLYNVYPPVHDWDMPKRKRDKERRRRTRSHQGGFSAWRSEADSPSLGTSSSGRPYLPYRGDQLSPGQQVKVLAPGGGVAVARVLTNQKSSWQISDKIHHTSAPASSASVTVILLSEPNRLQGSVVTVPLEKVLLAWPRA